MIKRTTVNTTTPPLVLGSKKKGSLFGSLLLLGVVSDGGCCGCSDKSRRQRSCRQVPTWRERRAILGDDWLMGLTTDEGTKAASVVVTRILQIRNRIIAVAC